MDLGDWLARGLALTWRYKSLWVFGFLAMLGAREPPNVQGSFGVSRPVPAGWDEAFPGWDEAFRRWLEHNWPLVTLAFLGLLLAALLVQLVALWGQGALILGSGEAAEGRPPALGALARRATARLLRLIGIMVLLGAPVFLATLILVVGFIVGLLLAFAQPAEGLRAATLLIVVLGVLAFLGCLLLLVGVLHLWSRLALRAALLEDLPWLRALRRGLEVGLRRVGSLLLVWLVLDVGVLGVAALIVSFLFLIPLLAIGGAVFFASLQRGAAVDPSVFLGLLFAMLAIGLGLLSRLLLAPVVTFVEMTWTLAYRSWVGQPLPSS